MKKRTIIVFSYFVNRKYSSTKQIMDWYESMKENYLVDCNRVFVIYTDNIEVQKKLFDQPIQFVYVDQTTTQDANENRKRKFRYINDYLNKFNPNFDYFCYVQSTARCLQKVSISELTTNNDLVIFKHCGFNGSNFKSLYGNNSGSVVELDEKRCTNLTYFYASHFIARKKILLDMCQFVNSSQDVDNENNVRVAWDDETYLNYYFNITVQQTIMFPVSIASRSGNQYCRSYCHGLTEDTKIQIINNNKYNVVNILSCFFNESASEMLDWYKSIQASFMPDRDKKFVIYTDNEVQAADGFGENVQFIHVDKKDFSDSTPFDVVKFRFILNYTNKNPQSSEDICYIHPRIRCTTKVEDNVFQGFSDVDIVSFSERTEQFFLVNQGKIETLAKLCRFVLDQYEKATSKYGESGAWDVEYFRNYAKMAERDNGFGKLHLVPGKTSPFVRLPDSSFSRNKKRVLVLVWYTSTDSFSIDGFRKWFKGVKDNLFVDCERAFSIMTDDGHVFNKWFKPEYGSMELNVETVKVKKEDSQFNSIGKYLKTMGWDCDYVTTINPNVVLVKPLRLSDIHLGSDVTCFGKGGNDDKWTAINELTNRRNTLSDISSFDLEKYKFIGKGFAIVKSQSLLEIAKYVNHARKVDQKYNSVFGVDDWTYVDAYLNRCMANNSQMKVGVETSPDSLRFNGRKVGIKIIIPCYRIGDKVKRCIDSILQQDFQDFHIVCVEDCSPDNTWRRLVEYKFMNFDKITLVKNKVNSGPGQTRNNGYYATLDSIPSELLWMVDGDDYLPNKQVLSKIWQFHVKNPHVDLINIGWTGNSGYKISNFEFPHALWGKVISPTVFVPFLKTNIQRGEDKYVHYLLYDGVPDQRIGNLDWNCYQYVEGVNTSSYFISNFGQVIDELKNHKFKKKYLEQCLSGQIKMWSDDALSLRNFNIKTCGKTNIPKIIWQFWTDDNPLTENRQRAIQYSRNNVPIEMRVLFNNDIMKMQNKKHPFHPAYQYLSGTHRADYLRCYFMHYYGGGYADVKFYSKDNNWAECFDILKDNEDVIGIGQHEIVGGSSIEQYNNPSDVEKLIANCYFMFRPMNKFTQQWIDAVHGKLDKNLDRLKACYPQTKNNPQICHENNENYPFRWAEILCDIIHPLEYHWNNGDGNILNTLESGRLFNEYR